MATTSRFSIGRDTLIRYVFEPDFFQKVPEVLDLEPAFNHCRETYKTELEKKGCSCRMTTEWAKDCLTQMLDRVDAAKKINHDLVRNFIRCVGKYSDGADVDYVGVTVIHDKTYDIFVDTTPQEENTDNANI